MGDLENNKNEMQKCVVVCLTSVLFMLVVLSCTVVLTPERDRGGCMCTVLSCVVLLCCVFVLCVCQREIGKARQGKARQLYLYSTFHTQGRLRVLHI